MRFVGIGAIIGAISATFFTFAGLFVKMLTGIVHPVVVVGARMLFIFVISSLIILAKREKIWLFALSDYVLMTFQAVSGFSQIASLFYAFQVLQLGDVITVASTSPVYIMMANFILYKRFPTVLEVAMIFLSLLGVVFCVQPNFIFHSFQHNNGSPLGYLMAVVSAVSFSAGYMLSERLNTNVTVSSIQFFMSLNSFIICLVYSLIASDLHVPHENVHILHLGLVCLLSYIAVFLAYTAIRFDSPLMASIGRASDIIISFLIDIFYFHEPPNVLSVIGASLILLSLILPVLVLLFRKKEYNEIP